MSFLVAVGIDRLGVPRREICGMVFATTGRNSELFRNLFKLFELDNNSLF